MHIIHNNQLKILIVWKIEQCGQCYKPWEEILNSGIFEAIFRYLGGGWACSKCLLKFIVLVIFLLLFGWKLNLTCGEQYLHHNLLFSSDAKLNNIICNFEILGRGLSKDKYISRVCNIGNWVLGILRFMTHWMDLFHLVLNWCTNRMSFLISILTGGKAITKIQTNNGALDKVKRIYNWEILVKSCREEMSLWSLNVPHLLINPAQ
jgi:hypothetical protein